MTASFSFVFVCTPMLQPNDTSHLCCHGSVYLYDVSDVGIWLGAAGVVDDMPGGVQMYQRPFAVWNVI